MERVVVASWHVAVAWNDGLCVVSPFEISMTQCHTSALHRPRYRRSTARPALCIASSAAAGYRATLRRACLFTVVLHHPLPLRAGRERLGAMAGLNDSNCAEVRIDARIGLLCISLTYVYIVFKHKKLPALQASLALANAEAEEVCFVCQTAYVVKKDETRYKIKEHCVVCSGRVRSILQKPSDDRAKSWFKGLKTSDPAEYRKIVASLHNIQQLLLFSLSCCLL